MLHMMPTPVDLRREEIEDSKRLTVAERLQLGGDLFDSACQVTLSGIRMQNPGIALEQARAELRRRLDLARRLETHCDL